MLLCVVYLFCILTSFIKANTIETKTDEFWDYDKQVDLEAFRAKTLYDTLSKQSRSVTQTIGKQKDEVNNIIYIEKYFKGLLRCNNLSFLVRVKYKKNCKQKAYLAKNWTLGPEKMEPNAQKATSTYFSMLSLIKYKKSEFLANLQSIFSCSKYHT